MATLRVPYTPEGGAQPGGKPIQVSYYQMAIGIDIDCSKGRVYWTDIAGKAIKSSEYNGTKVATVLDNGNILLMKEKFIFWRESSI